MPAYQLTSVTDSEIETGNYAMYVGSVGASATAITTNLGPGMVKSFTHNAEMFTSQSGNSVDPIEGVARETCTIAIDLIAYNASAFNAFSCGMWSSATSGTVTIGGNVSLISGVGMKLVNTRKLASGSTQTTTYVISKAIPSGFSLALKSDNDTDPVNVYSFTVTAKQYATAGTLFTKTVA